MVRRSSGTIGTKVVDGSPKSSMRAAFLFLVHLEQTSPWPISTKACGFAPPVIVQLGAKVTRTRNLNVLVFSDGRASWRALPAFSKPPGRLGNSHHLRCEKGRQTGGNTLLSEPRSWFNPPSNPQLNRPLTAVCAAWEFCALLSVCTAALPD